MLISTFKAVVSSMVLGMAVLLAGCSQERETTATTAADSPEGSIPGTVIKVGMSGTYFPLSLYERGQASGV